MFLCSCVLSQRQFSTLVDNKVVFYLLLFYKLLYKGNCETQLGVPDILCSTENETALERTTYHHVHICEVGLSGLPVNHKLLIVSEKKLVDVIY